MRIKALAFRIVKQIINDKRTLALILFAPLIVLSLVYFVFDSQDPTYKIGIINAPESFISSLNNNENYDIDAFQINDKSPSDVIKDEEAIAVVNIEDNYKNVDIYLDNTNATNGKKVESLIKNTILSSKQSLIKGNNLSLPLDNIKTEYVYGSENSSSFSNFGAPLIGIIVFFFVFLIAGINFLTERTSGTLEKLLSTPIKRSEIIIGYALGFSILALIQATLITLFVVYVLGLTIVGSIWLVLLVTLLTAITALTLGILLSTLANSEFQMVQFIPIVIVPQMFLCGLFNLSGVLKPLGHLVPLYYTTDALTKVIIKGNGFSYIWPHCLLLLGFSLVFMIINIRLLKKHRRI